MFRNQEKNLDMKKDFTQKLFTNKPFPKIIKNRGNDCYIIALIHCLFCASDFKNFILDKNRTKTDLFLSLSLVFKKLMEQENYDEIDVEDVKKSLKKVFKKTPFDSQGDPSELLKMVIEVLLEELEENVKTKSDLSKLFFWEFSLEIVCQQCKTLVSKQLIYLDLPIESVSSNKVKKKYIFSLL